MSGITQLPGPGPGQPAQPAPIPQPGQQLVSVPLMQPPSPYWVDPSGASVPVPSVAPAAHHYSYYAVQAPHPPPSPVPTAQHQPAATAAAAAAAAAAATASALSRAPADIPVPRPRKPYTTTKVREMWSPAEHERMLEGLRLFKRDWAKVTRYVGTRSAAQVRSHAQKYFDRVARDKTDDYVPRARPKRKSSTPYPRKARDDPAHKQTAMQPTLPAQPVVPTAPPSVPLPIPMQSMHYAPMHAVQHATLAHPMHTSQVAMQLASQPTIMPHLPPGSPYLTQPQQHPIVQQGVPQAVYSPCLTMVQSLPPGQDRQRPPVPSSPAAHPSPMSYMSGHAYAGHSPAPHQQQVSMAQPHVYSMFSPMTPGGYPPGVAQSPVVSHGQIPLVAHASPAQPATPQPATPQPSPFPTHSHPGGPIDNCAKCIALRRYGNVLREIGEIRRTDSTPVKETAHRGAAAHATAQVAPQESASRSPRCQVQRGAAGGERVETREVKDVSRLLPIGRTEDLPSSTSAENSRDFETNGAAEKRAHRAKVMKARKARARGTGTKNMGKRGALADSERSSESYNSSTSRSSEESLKTASRAKGALPKPRSASKNKGAVRSNDVEKVAASYEQPMYEVRTQKKPRAAAYSDDRPLKRMRRTNHGDSSKRAMSEDRSAKRISGNSAAAGGADNMASANSSPATRVLCERSEESVPKRGGSPGVGTYSPSERKEIFDAVKSLQILAKTSSSDSTQNGDCRNSQD